MTKIISLSSRDNVKYITFNMEEDFVVSIQKFLSDIGISRSKRKNLFKLINSDLEGKNIFEVFKDTLQVVHDKDKTVFVELFTGCNVIIVVIKYNEDLNDIISSSLTKHFEFKK